MYCGKCGAKLSNYEKFCPVCGTRMEKDSLNNHSAYRSTVTAETVSENKKAVRKKERSKLTKRKKVKIILVAVAVSILTLAITVTSVFFTGSAYSVIKDLKAKDYSAAVSVYKREVEDSFVQNLMLKTALNNYGEKVINKFKNGQLDYTSACEALSALEQMGFGNMQEFVSELTRINDENTAFQKANQHYTNGDYENAIREYEKITETSENYEAAQEKLRELYPKYISFVTERTASLADSGDFEQALTLINTALELLPSDADTSTLTSLKTENLNSYKSKVISEITELLNENQFTQALEKINHAISVDNNDDFQNTKATIENKYVESVTSTVQNHLDSEDYISASRVVNSALDVLPENADLKALKEKVEKATPTYLLDVCKPYQFSEHYYEEYINGEIFNMGGKSFTNGFSIDTSWNDLSYAIFNLENNYTQISFYTGHVDDTDDGNGKIKIYLDGILAKEIEANDQALPQKINIDITGVKQLKFEVTYAGGEYGFGNVTVK